MNSNYQVVDCSGYRVVDCSGEVLNEGFKDLDEAKAWAGNNLYPGTYYEVRKFTEMTLATGVSQTPLESLVEEIEDVIYENSYRNIGNRDLTNKIVELIKPCLKDEFQEVE